MQFFFNSIELCKTNEKLRITERLKKTFWVAYIIIESCFYFIFCLTTVVNNKDIF